MIIKALFWTLLGLMIYSYFGYTIILAFIVIIRKTFSQNKENDKPDFFPDITIVVAAYNEEKNIDDKVQNSKLQDYPQNKITQLWINDASTDETKALLAKYPNIKVLNQPERKGKIAAINLAMSHVTSPITIFSDANAMLSLNAIRKIVEPFSNTKVGCVAGEKRILLNTQENAAATGEGIYWKYESLIKELESNCNTTLSATGELYAIRTNLYEIVKDNTILDDFAISTNILKKGLLVKYIPDAYACERASANISEEKKRKIRIAAGSFQSLFRNLELLNPFKHPFLTFQYFSHKILRWFLLPLSLFLIPILNVLILLKDWHNTLYLITFAIQLLLFFAITLGWLLKDKVVTSRWIFLPYYLFMMNISVVQGFFRFLKGTQNVKWDKSLRQT